MTLLDIVTRASQRLNEGQSGPVYYPKTELIAAANEAQALFVLLTLCLEQTSPWPVSPASAFHHMLAVFPNWIAPLRIANAAGAKVLPSRLEDLSARNPAWLNSPGAPVRYAAIGADLVAIDGQPAADGTVLTVKYARNPVLLVNDTDEPEIRKQFHNSLVDYTIYRARQVEGGLEFQKAIPYLQSFLEFAQTEADYVRARAIAGRYDSQPFELQRYDRSKLLTLRKDLLPARKAA